MATDNRNNGNNRYNNRTTDRNNRYSNSGSDADLRKKSVRKVENTRFYERENPESNMRRVGRTSSEFSEERQSYSRRESSNEDSIPEFKSFRRHRVGENVSSERNNESRRSHEESSYSRYKSSVEKDPDVRRKRGTGNLYTDNTKEESDAVDDFDSQKSASKQKRVSAKERLSQKREDKKRRAEVIARSDDRSYRRRAVSKKRDRRIRSEQLVKAAVCALIIFVVLLITLTKCDYDDPYATSYVTPGTIEFMTDAKISFIREEVTCKADASGVLVAAVNEGDKVSKGSVVAYITTEERTGLVAELQEIEEKIKIIQKLNSSSSDIVSNDVIALDEQISELSRELALVSAMGNMEAYSRLKNEIDALFIKRNELVSDSQSDSSFLASLISERDLIKERINIYTKPVKAPEAGIVSFYIDGSESSFTEYSNALAENSSTDVVNVSSVTSAAVGKNMINENVAVGSAVAKIITSYDYYVAAVADGTIEVQDNTALSVKSKDRSFITEIDVMSVSHSSGKTLIVGKTSTSLVSSLGARTVDADVITGKYDGMKIPLSSLTEFDSTGTTARITLVRSHYVVYAYVNILAKDNEYAIISDKTTFSDAVIKDKDGNVVDVGKDRGVSVNDVFVLKPEFVEEGDLIS